jgi:hypothetical protein
MLEILQNKLSDRWHALISPIAFLDAHFMALYVTLAPRFLTSILLSQFHFALITVSSSPARSFEIAITVFLPRT